LKKRINRQILQSGIRIYQFPDEALINGDESEKKEDLKVWGHTKKLQSEHCCAEGSVST
jgi:hypothetical protein